MKTVRQLMEGLALLALAALNTQLSIARAQGVVTINWNTLTNWTRTSAPTEGWESIASSADGTQLAAVVYGDGIWTSINAGLTWTQTSAPSEEWESITSSSDGNKLAAVFFASNGGFGVQVSGQGIYTSTNAGATWTQTSAPTNRGWTSIASSSDGTKLAAAASSSTSGSYYWGGIYTSTDAGATWTQTSAPTNAAWGSIASSADGTKLAAVVNGGGIWAAQAAIQTNAPGLTISYSENGVMVSWPTNGSYTLQQNSDLTVPGGWTESSYPISMSNGTNSITVTPVAGTQFFRLTPL